MLITIRSKEGESHIREEV